MRWNSRYQGLSGIFQNDGVEVKARKVRSQSYGSQATSTPRPTACKRAQAGSGRLQGLCLAPRLQALQRGHEFGIIAIASELVRPSC